jgi:PTH1 family peptidyl-tRNA hydrolase
MFFKRQSSASSIILIVGLGNIGPQYEFTRHNIGFKVVDALAEKSDWQNQDRCQALIHKATIGKQEIILAKPTTMMNLSGQAVSRLAQYYKVSPENIWIVYDELDLPLGRIKIATQTGHNGHNGILSIQEQLGHNRFWRFRIGINTREHREIPGPAYVLQEFTQAEQLLVTESINQAANAIKEALTNGLPGAMKRYNKATVKLPNSTTAPEAE